MFRFAPAVLAASVLCAAGCPFDTGGAGKDTGGGSSGELTDSGTTGLMPSTTSSTGTTVQSASGSDATGSGGGQTTSATTSDASSGATHDAGSTVDSGQSTGGSAQSESTGTAATARSCADQLMANPNAASGPYMIADAEMNPVPVYCDMETAGGGWTLIARSVPGDFADDAFGWGAGRGAISSPEVPYSLDVIAVGIEFSEVLIGNRGDGYAWGENVYRLNLPAGFLTNTDNSVAVMNLTTVVGDCDPEGGPTMLRNAGFVGRQDVFWFRDEDDFSDRWGLQPDEFSVFYDLIFPCSRGGRLDGDSGMIFVR